MNKKKLGIIIIVLLIFIIGAVAYWYFFMNKQVVNNIEDNKTIRNFNCVITPIEENDYTVTENIDIQFVNDTLKEFTYTQTLHFFDLDKYSEFENMEVNWPGFYPIVDKNPDNLELTYYRTVYYKYENEGIDNYMNMIKNNNYLCEEIIEAEEE